MSKQEILKSVLLGSLVIASLAFGSFKANAADFNQIITSKSEAIPAIGFLQKTGKKLL